MKKTENDSVRRTVRLMVNGEPYVLNVGDGPHEVHPSHTLSHTLRATLGLTGTKVGCDEGACGGCTVVADGKAVLSCMMLTVECGGMNITTIEGLQDRTTMKLHPIQQSFVDHTAFQCGFCTPGMIMSAKALLDANPSPTEQDVKDALAGNFCRCISHYHIIEAVMAVAEGGDRNG